jgi:hypothetical protein
VRMLSLGSGELAISTKLGALAGDSKTP